MRILLAHMSLGIGGAETHLIELAKALAADGHKIVVATNGGVYLKELKKFNIKHYKVPLHNKNFFNILKSFWMLKKIIKNDNIDLIHAHSRIASFICNFLKIPMVVTAHFLPKNYDFYRRISKFGRFTLAVGEDIKDDLKNRFKIDKEKIILTVNGINPEILNQENTKVIEKYGIIKDSKKIVSLTRLEKNTSIVPLKLINSAEILNKKIKNLEIIIVGGGKFLNKLIKKAKKTNEKIGRKIIKIVGPQTEVIKFLKIADIFVGVSRSAFEAMLTNVPTIVGGNEGYLGIFREENFSKAKYGNFCCRNFGKISEKKLINDILTLNNLKEEEKNEISSYNKRIVLEHYTIDKMKDDALKAYKLALNI